MGVGDDSGIFWSELKAETKKRNKSMKQNKEDKAAGPALWLQSAEDSRADLCDFGLSF